MRHADGACKWLRQSRGAARLGLVGFAAHHSAWRASARRHAGTCDRLEEPLDLWRAAGEALRPEVVAWILDELDERDEQAPGVRAVHNESFNEDTRNLLLYQLMHGLREEVKQHA